MQCFHATSTGLTPITDSNRLLHLPESKIPVMSTNVYSVSQVLFSPDGSKLLATVKGLPTNGDAPGFLAAWDVYSDGSLSQNHSTYYPPTRAGQNEWGFTYLFGSEGYVVADAVQGAVLYDFSKGYDPKNVVSKNLAIPGQMASCWISYSSKTQSYFFTDAIAQIIFEYTVDANLDATHVANHNFAQGLGIIDSAISTVGKNQ